MKNENMEIKAAYSITYDHACVILGVEYGINDKLITAYSNGGKLENIAKNRIYSSVKNGDYFVKNGTRYYLNMFMKI